MKSLSVKFLLLVGLFAVLFGAFVIWATWRDTRDHLAELNALQAKLALEFDLAIRDYVGREVRPEVARLLGPGQFHPETMSTSFVARAVFDRVRQKFPGYVLKFSSLNPRNPANLAGPREAEIIAHFQKHPEKKRWVGRVELNGRDYVAHFSARRLRAECLACHGDPAAAPAALVDRYGPVRGFHAKIGDVALDTVAIPVDSLDRELFQAAAAQAGALLLGLLCLVSAIFLVFRKLVTNRLGVLSSHFLAAAGDSPTLAREPVAVEGRDEIATLAESYNFLAQRLAAAQAELEEKVINRTADLQAEVCRHQATEAALRQSESQMRTLTQTAASPIFILQGGRMIYVNPAGREVLGWGAEEDPADLDFWRLVHPADRPALEEVARQFVAGRIAGGRYEFRIEHPDLGLRWLDMSVALIPYEGRPAVLCTAFDMTGRHQAQEAALFRERLEAAVSTAGAACHELNQPLQAALMKIELLLLQLPPDLPEIPRLQEILADVSKLVDITQRLNRITDYRVLPYPGNQFILDLDRAAEGDPDEADSPPDL
ncbi:MAG: DUF3365 domain-containing protein [Deltaproteobacteria bacterium]|nr:DUF3365 domain-containing protein [Deltaproteobacteria bacterium]